MKTNIKTTIKLPPVNQVKFYQLDVGAGFLLKGHDKTIYIKVAFDEDVVLKVLALCLSNFHVIAIDHVAEVVPVKLSGNIGAVPILEAITANADPNQETLSLGGGK